MPNLETKDPKSLLICGCSFSSGWGFSEEKADPMSWPNIVADLLDYELTNIAETAYSNQDIFLNTMHQATLKQYDLILVQFTALGRVTLCPSKTSVTPNIPVGPAVFSGKPPTSVEMFTEQELQVFQKIFVTLNQDFKHLVNLIQMIETLQLQFKNLYFINGLIKWPRDPEMQHLIKRIDPTRWVNLEKSWMANKIDTVSPHDTHPGVSSNQAFATQVVNFIKGKTCQT
jgi:hypothetical protein